MRPLPLLTIVATLILSVSATPARAEEPPGFLLKWGTPGSGPGQFGYAKGIAIAPGGDVWVTDVENNRLQRFTNDGVYVTTFGGPGPGAGTFGQPYDIEIDATGTMYVTDLGNNLIQVFDDNMNFVRQWSSPGLATLALDPTGQHLYAAANDHMMRDYLTADGSLVGQWEWGGGPGCLDFAFDTGPDGTIYKTECQRVKLFSASGQMIGDWSCSNIAEATVVDASGNVYVTHWGGGVWKFAPDGSLLSAWGSVGSGDGQFSFSSLSGIAVDDNGNVFVVDSVQDRIQKFGLGLPVETRKNSWGQLKLLYR